MRSGAMGAGKKMAVKRDAVPGAEGVFGAKGLEAVGSADPKAWLAATPELVKSTRAASEFLFSVLGAHTESPLATLLTQNFDSEQIWQQIDLQATPTLEKIKKSLRKLENTPQLHLFRLADKKAAQRDDSAKGTLPRLCLNRQLLPRFQVFPPQRRELHSRGRPPGVIELN
jgi:hypothetical protein